MTDTVFPFALVNKAATCPPQSTFSVSSSDGTVQVVQSGTNFDLSIRPTVSTFQGSLQLPGQTLAHVTGNISTCADPFGNIWVNEGNTWVAKIDNQYDVFEYNILSNSGGFGAIIYNSVDGFLYLAEYTAKYIAKINLDGTLVSETAVSYSPLGLAVDSSGRVWYNSDVSAHVGFIFNGAETVFATTTTAHQGIVEGPNGNMWFTYRSSSLGEIDSLGNLTDHAQSDESHCILLGLDSYMYAAGGFNIYRIDSSGSATAVASVTSSEGIRQHPSGFLVTYDQLGNRIRKTTLGGTTTSYALTNGANGYQYQASISSAGVIVTVDNIDSVVIIT